MIMRFIPPEYKILAYVAAALAVLAVLIGAFTYGWNKGSANVQAKWDADKVQVEALLATERTRQAVVTVETVTRFVDRVRIVKEKAQTITREVPVYVTAQADADCVINNGFVRVHDAASAGTLPPGPSDTDAAASAVALSTVAETVTANYGTCHENAEQLIALQGWVKAVDKGGR